MDKKLISLCRPYGPQRQLIYKFGEPRKLDMVYPNPARGETAAFQVTTLPIFGGSITSVAFIRGRYEYRVYSKVGRSDGGSSPQERTPEFEDGILIFQDGKRIRQLVCDDGGEGFRENIEWIPGPMANCRRDAIFQPAVDRNNAACFLWRIFQLFAGGRIPIGFGTCSRGCFLVAIGGRSTRQVRKINPI